MVAAKDTQSAEVSESTGIVVPPCDLYSNEPQLETDVHLRQILALLTSLEGSGKIVRILSRLAT
jgi:hypothetical protein